MGFVKKAASGIGKAIGVGQQGSYDPYQFEESAFQFTPERQQQMEVERARQDAFISNLQQQAGGYDPLIEMLSAQARGEGPSLAEMQFKQLTDQNMAQQLGTAAAQRSVNPALAARMAAQGQADIGQQAAGQAAQIRLQELLQAQQQEMAAREAQSGTTLQGGNLATTARTQGLQDAEAERFGSMNLEELRGNQALGGARVDTKRFSSGQERRGNFVANVGAGLGSILSDKNAKKDIKKSPKAMDDFLSSIGAYTFKYKDDPDNEELAGTMAQDLERSKIGKTLVEDGPDGKEINIKRALAAVLASQGYLNKKLSQRG